MADEPAIPASRVSDAHDAMEGQPAPSCIYNSESGVSMRDGTTEKKEDACRCGSTVELALQAVITVYYQLVLQHYLTLA